MTFPRLELVPTVFILIFLVKIVNGQFDDPDFYWHLKTGEYIVTHGALPPSDIFSYTHQGRPWVLHEWLFQVIIYLVHAWGAELGVTVFVALVLTGSLWFCHAACARVLEGDKAKALIVTLLFGAFIISSAPRPHIFTFLFFSLFLYILLGFKYCGETARLWVIPLVMVLWANLHGGFFIGLVLIWLFILGEWMTSRLAGDAEPLKQRRLRPLVFTGIAAVLATLVNPEFIGYWLYPFQVIGMEASKGIIEEWRSPDFHQPIFMYWLLIVASFFLVMIHARKKPDATELVVPLVFVAGAFIARRNIPLAALALAPFVAVHLRRGVLDSLATCMVRFRRAAAEDAAARPATAGRLSGRHEQLMNGLLVLFTALALALVYPERQKVIRNSLNSILPVKAVDFILREGIEGRMFNTYHYGGYLIYRLYPRQQVFIDGRADMYGDLFIQDALAIYQGSSQWKERFEHYGIDYVICESEAPLRQLLLEEGHFRRVFDDGMHSVLVRDVGKFRSVIQRYEGRPARG